MKYFHNIFFLLIFLFSAELFSQKIRVIDSINERPINNVLVFDLDKKNRRTSNLNGVVTLDDFKDSDSIVFRHIVYENKTFLLKDLKNKKTIKLNPKALGLSEVVLSVTRNTQNIATLSRKVSVIDNRTVSLESPKTSAEILYHGGGIHIQKTQSGGGSPVIRGFEANRVLLVIDGVRMNNAIYRSGHIQNSITIDPNSLERTEVIYGPSSVGYGSDALGGVVHYYTKTPKFNQDKTFNYTRSTSYNLRDKSRITNRSIEISQKNWASYTSYTKSNFGDIYMGKVRNHGYDNWGLVNFYSKNTSSKYYQNPSVNNNPNLQRNTAYKQNDLIQKFNFKLGNKARLILNFQFSESSNINRFDKLTELNDTGNLKFAEWYYGPQKRTFISSKLNLYNQKLFDRMNLTLAYQKIDESRNKRKFDSNILNIQDENLDVISVNSDFFKRLNRLNTIAYGFELTRNNLDSNGYQSDINSNNIVTVSYTHLTLPTKRIV